MGEIYCFTDIYIDIDIDIDIDILMLAASSPNTPMLCRGHFRLGKDKVLSANQVSTIFCFDSNLTKIYCFEKLDEV